jgi:hypothetical protein
MKLLVRIAATLIIGMGTAYAAPHVPFLAMSSHGKGCAVGRHSQPVGDHSKPCPQPHGCAIGRGGPVGDRSKPCPHPHGCAVGNPRFAGERPKHCPKPHGNDHGSSSEHGHGKAPHAHGPSSNGTHSPQHGHDTGSRGGTSPSPTHGHGSAPKQSAPKVTVPVSTENKGTKPAHGHDSGSHGSSGSHGKGHD